MTNATHPAMEDDDRPLADALQRRGAEVVAASWDDATFSWSSIDIALLRSPWDYYKRTTEFFAWLRSVEGVTRVVNDPSVIRWNAHKAYMLELARSGVPVVPTELVRQGQACDLNALMESRSWQRVVLKPAVSADSWETIRIDATNTELGRAYLDRHRSERDVLIQPFIEAVDSVDGGRGERCLVFFASSFSHAVNKNSCFLGGRHAVTREGMRVDPAEDELVMATSVLQSAATLVGVASFAYARVDVARGADGKPILLELELFEPTLFFLEAPGSADRFASVLLAS